MNFCAPRSLKKQILSLKALERSWIIFSRKVCTNPAYGHDQIRCWWNGPSFADPFRFSTTLSSDRFHSAISVIFWGQIYLNGWMKMTSSCWEAGGALSPVGHIQDISAPKLSKYSRMPWGFVTCQFLFCFLGVWVCFCVTFVVVLHHAGCLEWAWIYATQVPFWLIGWLTDSSPRPPPPPPPIHHTELPGICANGRAAAPITKRSNDFKAGGSAPPAAEPVAWSPVHQPGSQHALCLHHKQPRERLAGEQLPPPPPPPPPLNLVSIPRADAARFLSLALGIKSSYALGTPAFKNWSEDPSV